MIVLQYTAPDLSNVYLAYTAETAEKAMEKAMRPKSSKSARPKSSRPKSSRPKSSKKSVSATDFKMSLLKHKHNLAWPSCDVKSSFWVYAIIMNNIRKSRKFVYKYGSCILLMKKDHRIKIHSYVTLSRIFYLRDSEHLFYCYVTDTFVASSVDNFF